MTEMPAVPANLIRLVGGVCRAAALLQRFGGQNMDRLIGAALLAAFSLCVGCQGHTARSLYRLPVQQHETDFLAKLVAALPSDQAANAIREYMAGRGGLDIAGASADGFETVTAGVTVELDPKTGKVKGAFNRASDPNVRAMEAAGAVASDIVGKAVSAAVSSQTMGLLGGASQPVGDTGALNSTLPLLLEFLRTRATTSNPNPSGPGLAPAAPATSAPAAPPAVPAPPKPTP